MVIQRQHHGLHKRLGAGEVAIFTIGEFLFLGLVNGSIAFNFVSASEVELRDILRRDVTGQLACNILVHQQGATETAITEEVEVLLDRKDVAAGNPVQSIHHLGPQMMGNHLFDLGFTQIVEALLQRQVDEVLEVARGVMNFQMLVQQVVVGCLLEQISFGMQDLTKSAVGF